MPQTDKNTLRVLKTRTGMVAAKGVLLATLRPSYGGRVVPVAGGQLVLYGPEMYVNRLVGAGLDRPITLDDFEVIERHSTEVGVRPMIEVSPETDPVATDLLTARGYEPLNLNTAFTAAPLGEQPPVPDWLRIVPQPPIDDPSHSAWLHAWQHTSAIGIELTDATARRVLDDFAFVAAQLDGDGRVLVEDRATSTPIATAAIHVRDGVGMLGAMSTVPEYRRRGVQAALLAYRRYRASLRGCDIAVATASAAGDSARNLTNNGFTALTSITTWAAPQ